ncbi:MAG: hypothetical protein ACK5LP_04190 [Campylobacteraceae bacterium]
MRLSNFLILITLAFGFSGCYTTKATYEIFERNFNSAIGSSYYTTYWKERREIYSEDKYIYISRYPKGCVYGYLTNKDESEEKVIGWIILKGEENCKIGVTRTLF